MANFVNTFLNPEDPDELRELQLREEYANVQSDRFEFLFRKYKELTNKEARRRYIEHFKYIQETVPGGRIDELVDRGIVYKSTQKVMEEAGAMNVLYKLLPEDGTIPSDYDVKVQKISVIIQFDEETGLVDELKTTEVFFNNLDKYIKKLK
jgi:hypothetical protein